MNTIENETIDRIDAERRMDRTAAELHAKVRQSLEILTPRELDVLRQRFGVRVDEILDSATRKPGADIVQIKGEPR